MSVLLMENSKINHIIWLLIEERDSKRMMLRGNVLRREMVYAVCQAISS